MSEPNQTKVILKRIRVFFKLNRNRTEIKKSIPHIPSLDTEIISCAFIHLSLLLYFVGVPSLVGRD